jgi:hypothetical protein
MNPALSSSAGTALNTLEDAFKLYADTLDFNIQDVKLTFTTRQYTFQLNWKCQEENSWTSWKTIKLAFQNFSLDLFKAHGFLVLINDPEVIEE